LNIYLRKLQHVSADRICIISISVVSILLATVFGLYNSDEEEYRNTILSTVLHAKAIMHGYYPFWTSLIGLGTPQPFSAIALIFHPLLPVFGVFPPAIAVLIFYQFHALLGVLGLWTLCQDLRLRTSVSVICSLTYLLCTPTLNYLLTDCWLTALTGWTIWPFCLWAILKFLTSTDTRLTVFFAILSGWLLGVMILNTHLSYMPIYLVASIFIFLAYYKSTIRNWKWVAVLILICGAISISSVYQMYVEYIQFPPGLERPLRESSIIDLKQLWSIFFRPLYWGRSNEIIAFNREQGTRIISFGGIFAILSLLSLAWPNIKHPYRIGLIICFLGCFIWMNSPLPIARLFGLISWPIGFRDPMIVCGILLAGLLLSHWIRLYGRAGKFLVWLLGSLQVSLLAIGAIMLLSATGIASFYLPVKSQVLSTLEQINQHQEGRFYFSPEFEKITGRLRPDGFYNYSTLAYHQIRLINGSFRGISMDKLYPTPPDLLPFGLIAAQSEVINNPELLDVLGIRYVVTLPQETADKTLVTGPTLTTASGLTARVLINQDAWPDAVTVKMQARSIQLPRLAGCSHQGLLCADFSSVVASRVNDSPIIATHNYGDITLKLSPSNQPRTVMVSELYRDGWKATTQGKNLEVFPIFEQLIGIKIPPGVSQVNLTYRPAGRVFTTLVSWITLIASTFALWWLRPKQPTVQ